MRYSNGFKARMVERMLGPEEIKVIDLAQEVGIPQSTLFRWLRDARTLGSNNGNNGTGSMKKNQQGDTPKQKRPQDWTVAERLQVVLEVQVLDDKDLGAFLRKKGLHEAQLATWCKSIEEALATDKKRPAKKTSGDKKYIRELEKELRRKDRALAEVTALMVLQKKMNAYYGGEGDDTSRRSGR